MCIGGGGIGKSSLLPILKERRDITLKKERKHVLSVSVDPKNFNQMVKSSGMLRATPSLHGMVALIQPALVSSCLGFLSRESGLRGAIHIYIHIHIHTVSLFSLSFSNLQGF